ncbi:2-dehydro-3-deoxy-D-gluconate 5-dehydrogenase [Lacunisphaera limnophila]|uniref:2-dehydro-3-deoxy-D-gluconate 5-dehydrogenase n=1 Tax=Lacunisphaera limnophila TaxID=1838286 RepID=A0A1D8AUB0_9BACT|nr:2-dehydro-3-deoxy-D-gluconate 5-dehydrogenase KduD [Lacunisphaera limnophila]AOS44482.1 2-dehydro-3-deoxy-D-gluconate 5-dehydrogenase [Lacunisphaera limnophila]
MNNILEQFRLTGKTALVTGAARGLGQGMALALAEAGADIVAVDILPADDTRQQVEALGRRCLTVTGNLGDRDSIPTVIADGKKLNGQLDILVNCAGIIRREAFENFTAKDWDDVMGLNIDAVFFLSQQFIREALARAGTAKIINIASMLSFQGGIRVPSYTASKSAVQGLTRLIASELGGRGINCNAIAPGYMATDNTAPLRADADRSSSILARIPAGRWGTPEDLKGAVVFLASPASDYVNGYTLAVDGGWLAR